MIKVTKGRVQLEGTARTLAAEAATMIRHVIRAEVEQDKVNAIAAYRLLGQAMADAAEELVEKHGIDIDLLNDVDDEDEDESDLSEEERDIIDKFVSSLTAEQCDQLWKVLKNLDEEDD